MLPHWHKGESEIFIKKDQSEASYSWFVIKCVLAAHIKVFWNAHFSFVKEIFEGI